MTDSEMDLSLLQQWVGRSETHTDRIDGGRADALAAVLDHPSAPPHGAGLPPLWHWMYFWSVARASLLGEDGHPQRGNFLPPVPLPRRMWAGGRLSFLKPLPIGATATRTSTIHSVQVKQGRSGVMAFVTVGHDIADAGGSAIREEHDIVYRAAPEPGAAAAPAKPAPAAAAWRETVRPDAVLLFRYSALTFNGHRIHYDRSYVTGVEGYPGLIVHGPLIATLLADLLQRRWPQARLAEFNFRALSPLFDIEPFEICGQPDADGRSVQLWAQNARGELAMQAQAVLAAPYDIQ